MTELLKDFLQEFAQEDEQIDFTYAHESVGEVVETISTGSYLLDDALSCGGLPKGRLLQFYGPGASGKTLLAMLALKNAQKEPGTQQLFLDAEGSFDPNWAATLGLDVSRIGVLRGDLAVNGQRLFEMLLGVPREDAKHMLAGKKVEGLLDKIINKEKPINAIVLDSLGAIIPPGEDVSRVGKFNISYLARFLTTTFRKLSLEVNKAGIVFIIINHKKDGMDMYGPDHTYSGGNSYSHFLSANIYFEAVGKKDATIFDDKEVKIGHTIRATVEKSKFGPHPRKCEFKVNFSEGVVDLHEEVAQLAINYGIIAKTSSVTHEYNDVKWVGLSKVCDAVKNDPTLQSELVEKIIAARKAKITNKLAEQESKKTENELAAIELTKRGRKAKNVQ